MEYMHLVGAEQVQAAGHAMTNAAHEMKSAASAIDETMRQHRQFMEDWLMRFEAVLERTRTTGGSQ